jgi:hypothetical protein
LRHAGPEKKKSKLKDNKSKKTGTKKAKRTRTSKEYQEAMSKEDRKTLKKAKAIANAPARQEKKRQRLLKRANALEAKGNKLLAEAKKIGEQYRLLTEAKKVCLKRHGIGSPSCHS